MATRSITRTFLYHRNHRANRSDSSNGIFSMSGSGHGAKAYHGNSWRFSGDNHGTPDDKRRLLSNNDDEDDYCGDHVDNEHSTVVALPPEWVDVVDNVKYEISLIRKELNELYALHERHASQPSIDDRGDREDSMRIETATRNLTEQFATCQRLVHSISNVAGIKPQSTKQTIVLQNVQKALAIELQEQSAQFRKVQGNYLKRMQMRVRSNREFTLGGFGEPTADDMRTAFPRVAGLSEVHVQHIEDNTNVIAEREREIQSIEASLIGIQDIFKDLAILISDQGTVLDRIDYNIDVTNSTVETGVTELVKADKYQKSSHKKKVIIFLVVVITVLAFAIAFKPK